METKNKKASNEAETNSIDNIIIAGKTYKINELNCIFSVSALMNATKEDLYKYWQMAIETGVKKFRDNVDNVFNKRYPRFE